MRRLLDQFRSGQTIYLPGATRELLPLRTALSADPGRMSGVRVVSCLLPGINDFDYAALDEAAAVSTFLLPPSSRATFADGRTRVLPLGYGAIARYLREDANLDLAVAHVAPPGSSRFCSLGICADFSAIAWTVARRRVAVVNIRMPAMARGPRIDLADADLVVEIDAPLAEVEPAAGGPYLDGIAAATAAFIPDGAAIQFGLGAAPRAVCASLGHHRGLRLRSGLAPEEVVLLADSGALAPSSEHQAGVAGGSAAFYRDLASRDLIAFADARTTHDAAALATTPGFHAVNSALQVDLFGQANLEWRGERLVGGCGGALDFARAGANSATGRSIVALPATAGGEAVSRIVARLTTPTISLGRADVDVVVTEHGAAELRGRSLDARAEGLIAIAAPAARGDLERAWGRHRDAR